MGKARSSLFLFLLLAAVIVGAGVYLATVDLPAPEHPVEQPLDTNAILKQE